MNQPAPAHRLAGVDRSRPAKTFADYAAAAVCPLLIMVLVGCLVFFLVEIGYAGTHLGKLRWTLFWFVLAMVLVSRIAIEKGYDYAGLYGLGLAAATAFVLTQYVSNYLGAWCILGLIWWATNKLTWDCTVIDDELDASGEGLLQAARLEPSAVKELPKRPSQTITGGPSRQERRPSRPPWWKAVYPVPQKSSNQPHAPGRWVIYFLLAALPGFGVGQGLIPATDAAARFRSFVFLLGYILAALGLLLVTSFLGLRRYLRQRHLTMPGSVSASWMALGSSIILGIVLVCVLLPRPEREWSVAGMLDKFGDPALQQPKKVGPGAEESQQATRQGSPAAPDATTASGSLAAQQEPTSGSGSNSNAKVGLAEKPALERNNAEGQGPGKSERPGNHTGGQPTPGAGAPLRPPPVNWLKVVFFMCGTGLVLFALLKNRDGLLVLWQKLWAWWRSLWRRSSKPGRSESAAPVRSRPALPAFASFRNPFASGEAVTMPEPELIVYSFDALQAWAEAFGLGRAPKETPFEFAHHLESQVPDLASDVEHLTRLYVLVAYGAAEELSSCRGALEILWSKLTREPPPKPPS